jgi:hypothetical protein
MCSCDVAIAPRLTDPITSQLVVDAGPITSCCHQSGPGEHAEVVRGVGHALVDLAGELFDRALSGART